MPGRSVGGVAMIQARAGKFRVDGDLETQLINEEPPASLLISNPNRGKIQPEKWLREFGGMRVT